ncbi:MAG: M1 family metallopeptidase [Deltaproteobacteria bacterium]|jgi:hypothetical protein|nr:M1 family metallopeptidase [Deltaproteobacteria bacterium]MBT6433676.1 M1 family metallopeptidase [Deltaproteobacteria bacterium]MBT6489784.1 M1 family metallopeptidase [Deltaproteobacteria bacterium]
MNSVFIRFVALSLCIFQGSVVFAAGRSIAEDKFRQLEEILPTPDEARRASGAPGAEYWQQRADYNIRATLDDVNQRLMGEADITYTNKSPDTLKYLWVQLDQNIFEHDSTSSLTQTAPGFEEFSYKRLDYYLARETYDGGYKIQKVLDDDGDALKFTIVDTMMRIDLPRPLRPGRSIEFSIAWDYNINNAKVIWGRTGYEYFEKDKNYIYEIAHWYPRMAAYTDVNGWHHKQFVGRGEFTLEFGDFDVSITVPGDHIVAATGELANASSVLTRAQRKRLDEARRADSPVYIVTPEEAAAAEKEPAKKAKTWRFKAKNVRDFAFASSRKFIWDAMGYNQNGNIIMGMSFYPNEAEPLWSKYSTQAVLHTIDSYSRMTFDYPYPTAISVNGPVGGMEYPMICFNGPRPMEDGTYFDIPREAGEWRHSKYGLIGVIIHEVGHFYFPMIVNSDERQWTWMDEGINTFVQTIAERSWEENYPRKKALPRNMINYMKSDYQVPIMTNSESLLRFGANAYGKPAAALTVLRDTVMGRELFDFAFKEYANRWKFKRPMPADFFRTMEDASGMDLDWFWRGWFYSTDHTDISIGDVTLYELDTANPKIEKPKAKARKLRDNPATIYAGIEKGQKTRLDQYPELADFYNSYDEFAVTWQDEKAYKDKLEKLDPHERDLLKSQRNYYVVDFHNHGGLVMPLVVEIEYENGKKAIHRIPAEIWRRDSKKVSKLFVTQDKIKSLSLDPLQETADADLTNNHWPPRVIPKTFKLKKTKPGKNSMQKAKEKPEEEKKKEDTKAEPKEEPAQSNTPATEAAG